MIIFFIVGTGASAQDSSIISDDEELNVAGMAPAAGDFFCSLWGNITSDMDIRFLLHGYDLIYWQNDEGVFLPNDTVVSKLTVSQDARGNRTFNFELCDDLYYSDGSTITARDYAFSMLLTMSPEAAAIGGNVKRPQYLLGYEDYISGTVPYLAGVRVLDDARLSITISRAYLPYFYELGLLSTIPYPISVIAPGIRVADDGKGVYLTNEAGSDAVFSAEMLQETILDPVSGYMSHPSVTSGPYRLVSFADGKAVAERNEYYKGDAQGFIPQIKRVTYEAPGTDELIPAFEAGEIDLLNKIASPDLIEDGLDAVAAGDGQLTYKSYPRTGLGFISFNTERPVIGETEVRQAIAHLFDKDAFVENTVGSNGLRVDGYYGMGQWMYLLLNGEIENPDKDPKRLAEWDELSLADIPVYTYDPEAAAVLLDGAGWNLNAEGGAYTEGVRYKQTDEGLIPLRLTLVYPEESSMAQGLIDAAETLKAGGIDLFVSALPLADLLKQYYGSGERTDDMLFLGTNFDIMFDPSDRFVFNEEGVPVWKETGLADQKLYDITVEMRTTEPGDLLSYVKSWLKFQQRLGEVLPILPLYSNMYYDFYPEALQDYDITSNLSWSRAIIPAYIAE